MTLEEYEKALAFHDWFYQYSDDHGVWRRGDEKYRTLRYWQPKLDPDYSIWNAKCPNEFKCYPKVDQ